MALTPGDKVETVERYESGKPDTGVVVRVDLSRQGWTVLVRWDESNVLPRFQGSELWIGPSSIRVRDS